MFVSWSLPEMTLASIPMLMMPSFSSGCSFCTGTPPNTIQVDTGGFTDFICTNCNEYYNGSFVVTYSTSLSSVTNCVWSYTYPAGCAAFNKLYLQLTSTFDLSIFINDGAGTQAYTWLSVLGSSPTCSSWSSTSVPYSAGWVGVQCSGDSSPVVITAL